MAALDLGGRRSLIWHVVPHGWLYPSPALPEGPAPWGCAGRDRPSEVWSYHVCLSLQPEEKQKAAQQFSKLQTAMKVLGISPDEQKACWLILAAIYHLGAAGATKGNQQLGPNNLPCQPGDLVATPAIPS